MSPAENGSGAVSRYHRLNAYIRENRRIVLITAFVLLAVIIALLIWTGLRGTKKAPPAPPPISVAAAPAKRVDFNIYITGLGTVTPLNTVTIRTRVDGQLLEVLFREGQVVERNALLARIDPRPFQAQLLQAEGALARDRQLLANARVDLERYRTLWAQDSIPKQQLDTQEHLVRQYEGTVKADKGLVESARVNLIYCRITAPVAGRVGLRLVDPGNIIHAADTNGLAVITQLEPITVIFPIPEDNIPQVMSHLRNGEHPPVEAFDREMRKQLAAGSLLTADNLVDPATGTVRLRAVFPNKGHELFPNQFVNARLLVNVLRNVVVIPSAAIQRGPQGTFVYLIKSDKTAEIRTVVVGIIQGGDASIESGLAEGDLVVTDGADRLREGARVAIRGPAQTGAPAQEAPR